MKKHVFLIQAHKQPELLERIIKRLYSENHFFIINVDEKTKNYNDFVRILSQYGNVSFNKRHNIMHGGFSQVQCTIDQIKFAYKLVPDFDYIHTISGQDYPCVNSITFDDFFQNTNDSFMMLDTDMELKGWINTKYKHRLEHWYLMDVFNKQWMAKIHLAGVIRRLIYWIPRKYHYWERIWGGGTGFHLVGKLWII